MKIIESDFEYNGYRCVTTFTDLGYRCGYVGVPEGHPLYRKDDHSKVKVTIKELCEDKELGQVGDRGIWTILPSLFDDINEYVNLGLYFMIHGGITYADGGKNSHHPVDSDLWWFGFDCGHCDDGRDFSLLEKIWGNNELVKLRIECKSLYEDHEIRSLEYVKQECRNLVNQIIKLINWRKK